MNNASLIASSMIMALGLSCSVQVNVPADLKAKLNLANAPDTAPPVITTADTLTFQKVGKLSATVTDKSKVTVAWTQDSGPGTLTFSAFDSTSTDVETSLDGTYGITITATDTAGNVAKKTNTAVFDSRMATVSFASPTLLSVITPYNKNAFPLSGSCSDNGQDIKLSVTDGIKSVDVSPSPTCNTAASPNWTAVVDLSTLIGNALTFTAQHATANNQVATASLPSITSYATDTTAPIASWTSNVDPFVRAGDSQDLSFSVSDMGSGLASLSYAYSADGTHYTPETSLLLSQTTIHYTIPTPTGLTPHAKIRLKATDKAGNVTLFESSPFQIATQFADIGGTELDSTGCASGSSTSTRYYYPTSVTTDGTNLYVFDTNHVLRKISLSTGDSTDLIGKCAIDGYTDGVGSGASLGTIYGSTILGSYLYGVDRTYNVLRKISIDPAAIDYRTVTTIAGDPTLPALSVDGSGGTTVRFADPYGITHDGTWLYVTDRLSHTIRKVDPITGATVVIAGLIGTAGNTNDPVPTTARFNSPLGITYAGGSLYISESSNYDIRRMDLTSLAVTTLSGTSHISGIVDGTAATTQFRGPRAIVADGTYLYVADYSANVIRKVLMSDGSTTTLAGGKGLQGFADGTGTIARFNRPLGMVLTGGFLYITDATNRVVRKVDSSTGVTSTLSGAPLGAANFDLKQSGRNTDLASFESVIGMTTDDGNIFYVSDSVTHSIRKIDFAANQTTLIAGQTYIPNSVDGTSTAAGFNNPAGMVKIGNLLYVADALAHKIRMINLTSGAVTTIAGTGTAGFSNNTTGTAAALNLPYDLATDNSYLYTTDRGNSRIRRISLTPPYAVDTIAGTGGAGSNNGAGATATFTKPYSLALSGSALYVGEDNRIRKIDLSSAPTFTTTTVAGSDTAVAGYADGIGNAASFNIIRGFYLSGTTLYVNDLNNLALRKVDLGTGSVSTLIRSTTTLLGTGYPGKGANSKLPQSFAIAGWGSKIYLPSAQTRMYDTSIDSLTVYQSASNTQTLDQGAAEGQIKFQVTGDRFGMTTYQAPYLYIADSANYVIKRMMVDGTGLSNVVGTAGAGGYVDATGSTARLGLITGLTSDANYLYFSDASANVVRRVALNTFTVDTLAGTAGTMGSADGTGTSASFSYLGGLTIAGGDLYVVDRGNYTVRKFSLHQGTLGQITTIAGSGVAGMVNAVGTAAQFGTLTRIASIGTDLYVIDGSYQLVRKIDTLTNTVSTLSGTQSVCNFVDGVSTNAKFCGLTDITSDGVSALYVKDNSSYIRKIQASTGTVTSIAGSADTLIDSLAGPLASTKLSGLGNINYVPSVGLILTQDRCTVKLLH